MRAQALAHDINIDRIDLQALDQFLKSERSPPRSMMLSDLDGFLTGIAVGPELIRPSEWLAHIWGGEGPEFTGLDEANAILGTVLGRYNEILREVADDLPEPVFWVDRDGTLIAIDWAEGFLHAIKLRIDAWRPLFTSSSEGELLLPILGLCGDATGDSLIALTPEAEDALLEQAADLIPGCIAGIARFWRRNARNNQTLVSLSRASGREPIRAAAKLGRNDPCPCGSGRKFKKCCGAAGNVGGP